MKNILSKYSFGVGDRFANQAKPQLQAIIMAKEKGCHITPVWNKSFREHEIIGSESLETRNSVNKAVADLGWNDPYFLDADHINFNNVDFFLDTCDFYTIDVADFIGHKIEDNYRNEFYENNKKYIGDLNLEGVGSIEITSKLIESVANKYLFAIHEAKKIYDYINSKISVNNFIVEVSMDETDSPQTPAELFFILKAISDLKIPASTIAPKFSGSFNKGVEYIGDLSLFKKEFEQDVAVIELVKKQFGMNPNLKLSVHSGSDKFSLYPIMQKILKKYDAGLHLKTAGTSWLEELIGLSESDGEGLKIAKYIYSESYKYYDDLCMPYLSVIEIDKNMLPTPEEVNTWKGEIFSQSLRHDQNNPHYNINFRQLLHVGYKIASKLDRKYLDALKENEKIISKNVTENIFYRHIKPLFLGV
tara:strand:+ start:342 stop:1595 length:1254 start_codon:yes stop_codon:yes gene_type:complete